MMSRWRCITVQSAKNVSAFLTSGGRIIALTSKQEACYPSEYSCLLVSDKLHARILSTRRTQSPLKDATFLQEHGKHVIRPQSRKRNLCKNYLDECIKSHNLITFLAKFSVIDTTGSLSKPASTASHSLGEGC